MPLTVLRSRPLEWVRPVTAETPFSLDDLYAFFPEDQARPITHPVAAADVPEPYQQLLVHRHHMTVTVERFYGSPVDVQVLQSRQSDQGYVRQILLSLQSTGQVVQFGIVHIDLTVLADQVRREIVAEQIPLGRVLINHNVLRTVEPFGFFEAEPTPLLHEWFGTSEATYGRLGVITADGRPAVRVVEILAPVHG
jgi:chorismate-pyruvate lyase